MPNRSPYVFDDQESLNDFLLRQGLAVSPEMGETQPNYPPTTDPDYSYEDLKEISRRRAQEESLAKLQRDERLAAARARVPPPNPEMINVSGSNYYTSVPPPNPNYVWVGNRDTYNDRWYRIGDPIRREDVGPTTFRTLNAERFAPEHHGINVPKEASMTDEGLRGTLSSWGLPTEGDRNQLFSNVVRGRSLNDPEFGQKIGMLEQNDPEATPLTEQEKNYLMGKNPYQESANVFRREREQGMRDRENLLARRAQEPQLNPSPLNQSSTNAQLQGSTTTTQIQAPNVVQPPPPPEPQGPLYGGTMRLGDEVPMSTSVIGSDSQTQTMTQPNLSSRIMPQANTEASGAAAAEEAGTMGGMEMMASRALPMMNMIFMGKMIADSLTADSKKKEMQQQQLMYRT